MRSPLNSYIESIPPSGIAKFFGIVDEMNDPDVLSLGVGEPDFDTPWHVRGAAINALTEGKTFYTASNGLAELRREISDYSHRRYGLDYDPEDIVVTVGGSEGIDITIRAMLEKGDEFIIPEPCYFAYKACVQLAGATPVIINLRVENEFRLTPEELEAAITPRTKMLIIAYPNNPTGAVMEREDLEKIAEVVRRHDLYVLSDEIYSELIYTDSPFVSIASLPGMAERTVVVNGFSKTFSMTGWRLGYVMGPHLIMEQIKKINLYAVMSPPTISQYAAIDALRNSDEDVEYMRSQYDLRRKFLLMRFKELGIPCFNALGAFYVFPDIRKYGLSSDEFAGRLLVEQKLAVVPGTVFGDSGEGFLRISYAYSLESLEKSMDRIEQFIAGLDG